VAPVLSRRGVWPRHDDEAGAQQLPAPTLRHRAHHGMRPRWNNATRFATGGGPGRQCEGDQHGDGLAA